MPDKIFLACPTHDGRINIGSAQALYQLASQKYDLYISHNNVSLLNWNCNQLWCKALNMRAEHNIKWFAMLHSDVIPEPYWLDKLIAIADANDLDMLSATVAIKDDSGDTSTGMSNPFNDHWNLLRISIEQSKEIGLITPESIRIKRPEHHSLEHVAINPKLLLNTGCMICRIDKPWAEKVAFRTNDIIRKNNKNQFEAYTDSEDWNFSRQVHDAGGKIAATAQVKTMHVGGKQFSN